ncbi:MAG: hypothetical protein AAFR54_14095 [Planctomycetota bacterium]
MPVWYEKTRALRESGELQIVAVTLEQHPDRARLYAQWKGYDFPILWDPFGLTGLSVVPVITGVDEHGITRTGPLDVRAFDEDFVEGFMAAEFRSDAPLGSEAQGLPLGPAAAAVESLLDPAAGRAKESGARVLDAAVEALSKWASSGRASSGAAPAEAHFLHGVALRLRYDSPHARAGDFQAALDAWGTALTLRPNQYVWRRRIQQWGPRLDKPYAFYDWVEEARRDLRARGEEPTPLVAPLSGSEVAGSEVAGRGRGAAADAAEGSAAEPDPSGALTRDAGKHVRLGVSAVPATGGDGGAWRVHFELEPREGAEWTLDADPPALWIIDVAGERPARPLRTLTAPRTKVGRSRADFGATLAPGERLRGYAVYGVCLDGSGVCIFRRQDFEFRAPG